MTVVYFHAMKRSPKIKLPESIKVQKWPNLGPILGPGKIFESAFPIHFFLSFHHNLGLGGTSESTKFCVKFSKLALLLLSKCGRTYSRVQENRECGECGRTESAGEQRVRRVRENRECRRTESAGEQRVRRTNSAGEQGVRENKELGRTNSAGEQRVWENRECGRTESAG